MVRTLSPLVLCAALLMAGCNRTATPTPNPKPPEGNASPIIKTGTMSTNFDDVAGVVAVSQTEDVFVAGVQTAEFQLNQTYGTMYLDKEESTFSFVRGFINRYRGATVRWSHLFTFPCPLAQPEADKPYQCVARLSHTALDRDDNSYVLAEVTLDPFSSSSPYRLQAYLYKFGATGKPLWRKVVTKTTDSRPLGLAVAPDGATYIAWQSYTRANDPARPKKPSTFTGFKLGKFDADGEPVWETDLELRRTYAGSEAYYPDIADVALADDGSVFVAGLTNVQKYSPDGTLIWLEEFKSAPRDAGTALPTPGERVYTRTEVSVGGSQVYIGRSFEEYCEMCGPSDLGFEVDAFSAEGAPLWRAQLGDDTTDIQDTHLTADLDGNVYVAGSIKLLSDEGWQVQDNFLRVYSASGTLSQEVNKLQAVGQIHDMAVLQTPGYLPGNLYIVGAASNAHCNPKDIYYCPNMDAFVAQTSATGGGEADVRY